MAPTSRPCGPGPGALVRVPVRIEHGGPNVIEFEVAGLSDELTMLNNKAVLTVEGVRDKLKVLLVSGEPHAGERTWRNLLKADANVDLVHFTILRPPEKQDGTPISELSLIAFPTSDLFGRKIKDFDLIIFDRYSNQTVLPQVYFDNIVRYVRDGGALMIAAGPDYLGARRTVLFAAGQDLAGAARGHHRASVPRAGDGGWPQTSRDARTSQAFGCHLRPHGANDSGRFPPKPCVGRRSCRAPTRSSVADPLARSQGPGRADVERPDLALVRGVSRAAGRISTCLRRVAHWLNEGA